jgi:hypothetical protein
MKWYIATKLEYSGYDCTGHDMPYLVAANSKEEVLELFARLYKDDEIVEVKEFVLPDMSKKRKAFILDF